ncbi:MAG: HipA family kinase [Longimicrobiales bacterium]
MVARLPTVYALRYLQPLREGGSLPAVVDTDDGAYVVKFRGAGQGPKALVAEIVSAGIARALRLPTPDIALVSVDPAFGASEPDPEIQDLLRASHGINVGLRFLDGAFNFALSAAGELIDPLVAARVVWMDALLTNPDRTHRNPNILVWQRSPWLIDHGAALYAHHDWASADDARTRTPFPLIRDHVLLPIAHDIPSVDRSLASLLPDDVLRDVLRTVPDDLLLAPPSRPEFDNGDAARARYIDYLKTRLAAPRAFVAEAAEAGLRVRAEPARPVKARR